MNLKTAFKKAFKERFGSQYGINNSPASWGALWMLSRITQLQEEGKFTTEELVKMRS